MRLGDEAVESEPEIRSFAFSPDSRWLALHRYADPEVEGDSATTPEPDDEENPGTVLDVRNLGSGDRVTLEDVRAFAFSEDGRHLAYAVGSADDDRDGVWVRDLSAGTEVAADLRADGTFTGLAWGEHGPELAFVAAELGGDDEPPSAGEIIVWADGRSDTWVSATDAPSGWFVPAGSALEWSEDGSRLFFTWRPMWPEEMQSGPAADDSPEFDAYDPDAILADRGVDVWHWQDPRIMTQQKVVWNREKERSYRAVRHRGGDIVPLGAPDLPDVSVPDAGPVALAESGLPYQWESTWTGGASDAYVVDLQSGQRTRFAEGIRSNPALSPAGRFVVWYQDEHYHLFDVASGESRAITTDLGVPIADEDHDFPNPAPGYGVAGWLEGDAAVLINDKYDIWVVPTDGSSAWSLTDGRGRAERRIFRLENSDGPISADEELLLRSYHDLRKNHGFYRARADRAGVTPLLEADKRFAFVAAAEDADRVLFTREAYDEFPDLWVSDRDFTTPRKISDVNPGLIERFAWGTAELLEWQSLDGRPLQGVVIKPGNYEEGRRYPVLVYYYRFMSQRLHEFNDPSVNHRPSFPVYASDDYIVFLPDVRFEVGRPGLSSTKSVVPGVQKLIEVGLADPDAIALHGHSWSGYQTAFMVTQTNLFTTAIAGAPVANMTSAYSGIRLGSGLARQFQYEMTQSRIGASPWEALDEYIENSPVFYADRIETPMLLLHGDADDAVPWEQSIEMFLAMRRLGKEAVLLQYRDEPHHPQQYANKLDWATKMKEWVDHYLKGTPAPAWISEGVPYRGR
jgi:dipeptidyl aminopeptidase/acylaminoacyl peptidase